MSNQTESAKIIAALQDRMVKQIIFRRWMVAAGVHISHKQRNQLRYSLKESVILQDDQIKELVGNDKNVTVQEPKRVKPSRKIFNLKYGDIVYFKCYQSFDTMENYKGVISGDGIASNKLECLQNTTFDASLRQEQSKMKESRTIQSKYSQLLFQKCLFEVVNAKKYYFQQKLKESEGEDEELKNKAKEEIEENENNYRRLSGQNVVFGEEIQLVHLYSQCVLTLNIGVLAKQNCCRELSLEEFSNQYSNFRIYSLNSAKKQGEPILYSDQAILVNSLMSKWKLSVQDVNDKHANVGDGLEVNGSETAMSLKICNYLDNQTSKEIQQKGIKGKFIQSGDVITIKSRNSNGLIAIKKDKKFSEFLEQRRIFFTDPETNARKSMTQDYFEINELLQPDQLKSMYTFYVDTSETMESNIDTLWEIQAKDSLTYSCPSYDKCFLIKHVLTGTFLVVYDKKIEFTYNGLQNECLFYLKSKKPLDDPIPYSESAKIQSYTEPSLILLCDSVNDQIRLTERQRKSDMASTVFVFGLANSELSKTAQRLQSLHLYLFQFYIFLQNWGVKPGIDQDEMLYDYNLAFNSQKTLSDEVRQLFQSLDNLKNYLTNNFLPTQNEEIRNRQNNARESGLINILISILMLIHFMIYGSSQSKQQYYEIPGLAKQKQKQIVLIPDKSAQKIAKQKLDPPPLILLNNSSFQQTSNNCIQEIYAIIQLCIRGNQDSCNYLTKLNILNPKRRATQSDGRVINFLLNQLHYHRQPVQALLKESVRYTDVSGDNDHSALEDWIKQLDSISDDNIQDQSLYIEIISLIMTDPYENPIRQSQNLCRKLIFKSKNGGESIFNKSLIRFLINDQGGSSLIYQSKVSTDDFKVQNPDFTSAYQTFCFKNRESKVSKVLLSKKDLLCAQFLLDFVNLPTMRQQVRPEEKKIKIPILSHYETYTLNVLNLYAALCKGRNHKSIECIRSQCGIDQSFLLHILPQLKEHQLRYETALLNLYSIISIDCDPLVSIRQFTNNCYIQEDIMTFDLNGPTGVVFFDHSSSKSMKKSQAWRQFHDKNFEHEHDQLSQDEDPATQIKASDQNYKDHEEQKKFAEFIINKQIRNGIIQRYINFLSYGDYQPQQEKYLYPNHLRIKSDQLKKNEKININYKLYAQFQLEFMLSVIKLINFSVDLGYNDLQTNIQILALLPNVFYSIKMTSKMEKNFNQEIDFEQNLKEIQMYVEKDEFMKQHREKFQRNWLIDFFLWTTSIVEDKLLVLKVQVEVISLLKTFYELKRNLQILKFIGFHQNNPKCKIGLEKKSFYKNYLYNKKVISNISSEEEIDDDPDNITEITKITQLSNQSFMNFLDIFGEKELVNFNSLLFYDLYSQEGRTRLNEDLLSLLISNFNYYNSLNNEMKSIEIISNAKELELFTIINGNNKKFPSIIGPNELAEDAYKLVKIIVSKQQTEATEAYDNVNQYIQGVLDLYNTRVKKNYLQSFQNILRNAGIHKILFKTIVDPKKICLRVENMVPNIVQYYKSLISFFEMFTEDNELNCLELYPEINIFLDLVLLPQKLAFDINYVPLKVTRLVIQILSWYRLEEDLMSDMIELIVQKIDKARLHLQKHQSVLKQMGIFDKKNINENNQFNYQDESLFSSTKKGQEKEIILLKGMIQYLKILKSLTNTNEKPNTPIAHSKHLILQKIMKDISLKFMILPQNFFPELRNQVFESQSVLQTAPIILQYNYIKLHSTAIILLTECCRNYRLGIQETQRTLLYDELKTIMLKPSCYYIIKRAYLMLLFEVYINRVQEKDQSNEIIENDEVADILSRIIIPDIDQKQVYKFLEGLVRPNSTNQELKKQIARKKVTYFEKKKDMRIQQDEGVEEGVQFTRSSSVLRDSYEFWKYIRDHGVIYFLVCVYDEMKDRVDLEKSDEQSLADEFSIIKNNIQKLKEIFKILEQDFRLKQDELNLEEYRDLILSIEEIVPQRKITKFGKNFLIGFGPNTKLQFEKFDTLNEDIGGEKKIQEQENVQVINNTFKRNIKIYLLRFMISIDDLLLYCENQNPEIDQRKPQDIMPVVNAFKTYIMNEELVIIEREDMLAIQQEKKLKEQQQTIQQNIQFDKWEIFKIAMRQMFQRKKIGKSVEENHEKYDVLKEEKDQQAQQDLIEQFERYVCIIAKLEHVQAQSKQKRFLQNQFEEEINIEEEQLKQEEQIQDIRRERYTDLEKKKLLGDTQIELLMWQLLEDQNHKDNQLTLFLSRSIDIFNSEEIYVIKFSRILLEGQMPSEDEMEQLGRSDAEESIKIQKKLSNFKSYQILIANSMLDLAALQMMSSNYSNDEIKIEAIKFLIMLMKYGNDKVQNRIYVHLTSNPSLQNDFFNYLRQFLSTNIPEKINEIRQSYIQEAKQKQLDLQKGDDQDNHQETQFECLSLCILQFLQVLCENVNEKFQKYLSIQNEDDTYASNINIVIQVSEFLSFFLEDNQLKLIWKNEILCQCMETLIEFCTGYENNRKELCNNRRLFSLMNQKLLKDLKLLFDRKTTQGLEFFQPCTSVEQVEEVIFKERAQTYSTFKSMVRLLLAMTAGNTNKESVLQLIEIIDLRELLACCRQIFNQRIRPRMNSVLWDKTCTQNNEHQDCKLDGICQVNPLYLTDEDNSLIETGFNIFILFMNVEYLQLEIEDEDVINLFSFDQDKKDSDYSKEDDLKEQYQIEQKKKEEERLKKLKTKKQQVHVLDGDELSSAKYQQVEQFDQLKEMVDDLNFQAEISDAKNIFNQISYDRAQYYFKRTEQFFQFYREFIGRVEIQKQNGNIQKVFFQKPFFTKYITDQIKTHLILKSNRDSDQNRVLSLIENSDFYYAQMIHNQRMTRWKILDIGAKNWRYLKDISFILCLLLVILLIMYFDVVQGNSINEQQDLDLKIVFLVNSIVTIIQLILNALISIFSAIERYPISTTYKETSGARRLMILKKQSGFHTSFLDRSLQYLISLYENQFKQELVQDSYLRQAILVLLDFHNIYNAIILILTIYAYNNSYIYAILLLDIIYRSEDLQNIIKSITLNWKNLGKFTFLGLVGLLLYAIMGFTNYKDLYNSENGAFSDTFILAVTSTIQLGLRSGGGIGDAMTVQDPSNNPNQYWGLYFFEFTFFILFNILFIQMIFGIILDTFGELRDERQALLKEVTDKCFVCSLNRNDIDSKGKQGWYYHIYLEHNVYHTLFYIIYVKKKNLNDCNALEKYVKLIIQEKGTDFFPLNKCLQLPETLENTASLIDQ